MRSRRVFMSVIGPFQSAKRQRIALADLDTVTPKRPERGNSGPAYGFGSWSSAGGSGSGSTSVLSAAPARAIGGSPGGKAAGARRTRAGPQFAAPGFLPAPQRQ